MSDATQIIAAHMYDFETWTCMCQLDKPDSMTRPEWAAHVHHCVCLRQDSVHGALVVADGARWCPERRCRSAGFR